MVMVIGNGTISGANTFSGNVSFGNNLNVAGALGVTGAITGASTLTSANKGITNNSLPAGTILQMKSVNSGFVNQTINSTTPVALTNMSVSITPFFTNSKIVIQASISASWTYVCSVHIYRNGSDIVAPHGGNNQTGGGTAVWTKYFPYTTDTSTDTVFTSPVLYEDTPGVSSALTYAIYANSGWNGGSNAFYFNNRAALDMLGCSHMTVWEIAQ